MLDILHVGSRWFTAAGRLRTVRSAPSGLAPRSSPKPRASYISGRQAPIQIYRGIFTPGTFNLVAPAKPVFVGFVDEAPIVTAALNGTSKASLRCVSQTVELTRKNPAVRSHESQIARATGDNFYKDVNTVGDWEVAWGEHRKNGKSVQTFIGITGNPQ